MAESAPSDMTVDEFLVWAVKRPGRHELEFGTVIAMSPESLGHVRAKTRIQRALDAALGRAGLDCEAVGDGVTVRVDATTAYEPDASVYCGPRQPANALVVVDPVIVVEVVSPSSVGRGHNQKLVGYFMVPSLQHYLIVNPERRVLVHHARRSDEIATRILRSGGLTLDPPGFELPVEELFGASHED